MDYHQTIRRPDDKLPKRDESELVRCNTASEKCGSSFGKLISFCHSPLGCFTRFSNATDSEGKMTLRVIERGCIDDFHGRDILYLNANGIHNLSCKTDPQPCNSLGGERLVNEVLDRRAIIGRIASFLGTC